MIADVAAPVVDEKSSSPATSAGDRHRRRHHDELRLDLLGGKETFVLAEVVRHDRKALRWNMNGDLGRHARAVRTLQHQR